MSNSLSANDLFGQQFSQGLIGQGALTALTSIDLGAQINNAMGVSVDQVEASEVFLVQTILDDSSSIAQYGNEQNIRDGINLVVESLHSSKSESAILIMITRLNRGVLTPYVTVDQVPKLDDQNYQANGNTPLYDHTIQTFGAVLAKEQEFRNAGVTVRTATLIVSDGADCGSAKKPKDCAAIAADMLGRENHLILAMGIDDGRTDFTKIFTQMGVPAHSILTPKNTQTEIRKAFQVFSRSSVQASKGAAGFSKIATQGVKKP